jgi:hypothetical protein
VTLADINTTGCRTAKRVPYFSSVCPVADSNTFRSPAVVQVGLLLLGKKALPPVPARQRGCAQYLIASTAPAISA